MSSANDFLISTLFLFTDLCMFHLKYVVIDNRIRTLIVACDEGVREELRESVNGLGHPVCGAVGCARKALAKAERCSPELALIDFGLDGAAAAERIRSRCDISDGVVVADRDGKFTMFNPSAESVVGIGKLDLETEQWSESYGVFQPDRTTRVATGQLPLVRAINGESTDGVELFIRNQMKPDGVFISVSGRPLDRNGVGAGGGVIVFRDVTARVFAEEAHLDDDRIGRGLTELANAVSAHREDWIEYLRDDPQGRQVLPFILALGSLAAEVGYGVALFDGAGAVTPRAAVVFEHGGSRTYRVGGTVNQGSAWSISLEGTRTEEDSRAAPTHHLTLHTTLRW